MVSSNVIFSSSFFLASSYLCHIADYTQSKHERWLFNLRNILFVQNRRSSACQASLSILVNATFICITAKRARTRALAQEYISQVLQSEDWRKTLGTLGNIIYMFHAIKPRDLEAQVQTRWLSKFFDYMFADSRGIGSCRKKKYPGRGSYRQWQMTGLVDSTALFEGNFQMGLIELTPLHFAPE